MKKKSGSRTQSGKSGAAKHGRSGRPAFLADGEKGTRLQKFLANAGVDSRRNCEELIRTGRVTVDGEVVKNPAVSVHSETQDVRLASPIFVPDPPVRQSLFVRSLMKSAMPLKDVLIHPILSFVLMVSVPRISMNVGKSSLTAIISSKLISETKCIDGHCRRECKIASSACPHDRPIRCGDSRCVALMAECASIRCPTDTPYRCGDGTCKMSLKLCRYPYSIRVIKGNNVQTKDENQIWKLMDQRNRVVGQLITNEQLNLVYKAVPLSEVAKTSLNIHSDFEIVYNFFFARNIKDIPPEMFIRSVIIQITTNSAEEISSYNHPFIIELNYFKAFGGDYFEGREAEVSL